MNHIKEWIKKEDLLPMRHYKCVARNFTIGMWDGKVFKYTRNKFNQFFVDEELHWDEGPPFGTVKPIEIIEE